MAGSEAKTNTTTKRLQQVPENLGTILKSFQRVLKGSMVFEGSQADPQIIPRVGCMDPGIFKARRFRQA